MHTLRRQCTATRPADRPDLTAALDGLAQA